MGFRALKEKRDKRKKRVIWTVVCVFVGAFLIFALVSLFIPHESWKYYYDKPDLDKRKEGELRIHFLDVGQGDCTLIELPDGKVTLIDGGDSKSSTKMRVMRYLNALDIKRIDHLVVTHTDKDHCGSLTEVFRYKKVVNAYLPHTYEEEDVTYAKVYAAALKENCQMVKVSKDARLSGVDAPYTFSFLYPNSVEAKDEYSKDSAVLWLDYKGVSALFCGDADVEVEKKLLRDDKLGLLAPRGIDLASTEILKVAHHGSDTSTSQELVERLQIKTAILSCGKDNPYGHPAAQTMQRLEGIGAEIFRTDRQGHIVVTVKQDGSYSTETLESK